MNILKLIKKIFAPSFIEIEIKSDCYGIKTSRQKYYLDRENKKYIKPFIENLNKIHHCTSFEWERTVYTNFPSGIKININIK